MKSELEKKFQKGSWVVCEFRNKPGRHIGQIIMPQGQTSMFVIHWIGDAQPVWEWTGAFKTIRRYKNGLEIMKEKVEA